MRALHLVLALPVLGFAACSGDSSNQDGGPDATGSDVQAGDVVMQDAVADVYVPPVLDACAPIDGGLACDPGHVKCGPTLSCNAGSQFCCITNEAGAFACDPVDAGMMMMTCGSMMTGAGTEMFCDEAANCPNSELCCGYFGQAGGFASSCAASCPVNAIQLCHGNAECGSNGPCIGQTCHGQYVQTCGGLAECP